MAKKENDAKKSKSNFLKEMKSELKKVVWPTKRELASNTSAVIAFVVIIAVIVFALDFCFDIVNKYGIVKLQESVQSSLQSNIIENGNAEEGIEENSISQAEDENSLEIEVTSNNVNE